MPRAEKKNLSVYIAACCCQYYVELIKYKDKLDALGFTSDMYEIGRASCRERV